MAQGMTGPLVSLDKAGVKNGGKWLVQNVGIAVRPGEIVTLIGPNGSGKSTTAKMVTGVLKPTSGSIQRRPGLRIGYVPQKLNVDWTLPLTVKRLMNLTGHYDAAEITDALQAVGAAHLQASPVQELSGGEFQRALLARAMIGKPELLVLDEPVQGVDFAGEVALYDMIGQIRDRLGCGVLLISHDLHVVMAATDTVICMNGHVCCRGAPEMVLASDEYKQLFGPRAAQTLAVYQHHHDHTHLPDGRVREADGSISAHDHHHGPSQGKLNGQQNGKQDHQNAG